MAQQYLSPSSSWQNHSSLLPNHPFCFPAQKLAGMSAKAVESTSIKSTWPHPHLCSWVPLCHRKHNHYMFIWGTITPHPCLAAKMTWRMGFWGQPFPYPISPVCDWKTVVLSCEREISYQQNDASPQSLTPKSFPFYSSCLNRDRLSRPPTEKLSTPVTLSPQVFVPLLQRHPHRAAAASLLRQLSCFFFCLNLTDSFCLTALFPWKLRFSSCWEVWKG